MVSLSEKLHKWSVEELNLVSEGGLRDIPSVDSFKRLTEGKHKKIWNYVVNHLRSKTTVEKVKRTLNLKKLREKEHTVSFKEVGADVAKLQTAVSKSSEKRMFLTRTLSKVEERVLSLEQKIEQITSETNRINQKAAFLELLTKKYNEKDALLKIFSGQILSHINYLHSYNSSSRSTNQPDLSFGYGFLYDKFNNEAECILKKLCSTMSMVIKIKCTQSDKNEEISKIYETIQHENYKLKKTDFLLTDLVMFLKSMSDYDMQQLYTLSSQNVSVTDFILNTRVKDPVSQLLSQIKYMNVQNSLCVVKNRKKNIDKNQILVDKSRLFKNKIGDVQSGMKDIDFEIKITLIETTAENEALIASNNYLEESLKIVSSKTETYEQSFEGSCQDENVSLVQNFYKNADLAFYLSYTSPDIFQKILNDFNNLQTFAHNELFQLQPFVPKDLVTEVKAGLVYDRKLMWDYCEKTNMITPFYSKLYDIDPLSSEINKLLIIHPFENIGNICRKVTVLKEALKCEAMAHTQSRIQHENVSITEIYVKIIETLDKIEASTEEGTSSINDGLSFYIQSKTLIQEWWEQNAQFIPPIEYEGKNLKMWLDLLGVLTEFEPTSLETN